MQQLESTFGLFFCMHIDSSGQIWFYDTLVRYGSCFLYMFTTLSISSGTSKSQLVLEIISKSRISKVRPIFAKNFLRIILFVWIIFTNVMDHLQNNPSNRTEFTLSTVYESYVHAHLDALQSQTTSPCYEKSMIRMQRNIDRNFKQRNRLKHISTPK